MSIDLVVLVASNLANLILGLFVIYRNPGKWHNRLFGLFASSLIFWTSFNYLADNASNYNLLFTRLTFFSSIFLIYFITRISQDFPDEQLLKHRLYNRLQKPFTLVAAMCSISPWFVSSVEISNQGAQLSTGSAYWIFIVYLVQGLVLFTNNFLKQYQNAKDSARKSQIKLVVTGTLLYAGFAIFFSVILPELINDWSPSRFGPLFTVFFVGLTGYAIIRHKLFDIRLIVARTMGYLLSVGVLATVYGLVAFTIIGQFIFTVNTSQTVQQLVYTILAVVLAFTFQPLKRFFDRWSNRLFYRDAYDSQELLNNLNTVLVGNIELEKLLGGSAKVIAETIKSEFCIFGVKATGKSKQRIVGSTDKEFSSADIAEVRSITPKLKVKTIITDELDETHAKLREVLRKNDIALIVRLTDTPSKNQEGLGYIVMGAKKSGSPYSRQDIRVLEIIADELVIAIQNALRFEEIKNFNVTLQDKVDDATKQLRKANQRLIELDQTKDDFISMASHQLRTPLTSVKGYISMVMEGDAGKITKKQNELLDQAFVSAQRMVYLIADLLNVSRLRTGKFVIEPKQTNLAEIIEGEIAQLIETAKGRNLELSYSKPKSFPNLMLDETKIRQVIMNFADNAIYYTPSGGHIKVALEDKDEAIEFTVTDDGIGVPKAEQHHLFNKFYRAHNAKKARPDGTGLGLFMAKKVVAAQGGSIIFTSQENKGSTFGFTFTKQRLLPENFKGVIKDPEKVLT